MKGKLLLAATPLALFSVVWVAAQSHFDTSLHFTREGKRTAYKAENGGFESITGVAIEDLGCLKCHSSTGQDAAGNPFDPATYVPGCNDCHDTQWNVQEETCLNCHSRQKLERNKFAGVDVHQAAGLTCMDCHSKEELHGDDGVAYTSLLETSAIRVECEDCHSQLSDTPAHVIHGDNVDCGACHEVSVINCVSCHFESLLEGAVSRPNTQVQDFKLLLKRNGKVRVGALNSHTFDGKTNFILSSFDSHIVQRDATDCEDCHFNFGATNKAIQEYNESGTITLNKWNEETKKIDGPQGVVPIPFDWQSALKFDFAVYTGDPASATTDPEAWQFLKSGADNAHLYFAEPLDAETMEKLGMVAQTQGPEVIDTFYFPLFGDGVTGNIQFKTSLMMTNVGEDATLALEFYDRFGAPMQVMLESQGPDSMFEVPVWKGRT
ncbi:MAG: hypothetical protein ACE5JX_19750 [Acidobacteriota bacterium]